LCGVAAKGSGRPCHRRRSASGVPSCDCSPATPERHGS
jgi:hypothetical protein